LITLYDKIIMAFYVVFILTIGLIFRRLSKNTSDYFRCGGAMPWWITGTSAWLATFSAWAFTGAAGKVYDAGTIVMIVFYASVPAALFIVLYTGVRFRRMRVVTYVEAVLQRYGRGTQQFYTYIRLVLLLFFSGVGINAIGVFISAVFHIPVNSSLIVLGTTVTIVALVGGAWAVLASDFVQMLLVMTIAIVTSFLALRQPAVHGVTGLVHQLPDYYFKWTDVSRPAVLMLFIVGFGLLKFFDMNQMEGSVMYLMAKSDKDARRMALIPLIGGIVGPVFWIIPAMVAHVTHPNLAAEYHGILSRPEEAAFVAVSRDVMPNGLMALLLCAMFGATLTSTDAGLNKGAGVFVRNFYQPILAPRSSEKHLLVVSKVCTGIFGAIIILIAILVNQYRQAGLFDLTNKLAGTLLFPLVIPLFYGLFFKRTPAWSGWSTSLVGFAVSLIVTFCASPEWCLKWFGIHPPLNAEETGGEFATFAPVLADLVVCSLWFFGTSLFYDSSSAAHRASVEQFFKNLATPIDGVREGIADYDTVIYKMIGLLCLVWGGFVLLLMAIPQASPDKSLCFLFIGGVIFGLGAVLFAKSRIRKSGDSTLQSKPEPEMATPH
jgi:SSS family solute:Na+ symporter